MIVNLIKNIKDLFINDLHILRTKGRRLFQGTKVEVRKHWQNQPKMHEGINFQDWFDSADSIQATLAQAEYDFHHKILPSDKNLLKRFDSSCEIGFGGGRLLVNAAKLFHKAYGIDIHESFDRTSEFLASNNIKNFKLINYIDRENLPEIHFFYSFIVIQHFDSISILEEYLDLIKEKLAPNGVASLWYARLKTPFFGSYYEVPDEQFRVRECSLFLRPNKMIELLSDRGFVVVDHTIDNKRFSVTKGDIGYSMQAHVVFTKGN